MIYIVEVTYNGYDPATDRELEKLAGRPISESGYWFASNDREIGWLYKQKHAAEALRKKLKLAGWRRVKIYEGEE